MRRALLATSAALALAAASPAAALEPESLWASWSPSLSEMGFVHSSVDAQNGGIVVRGLKKTDAEGETVIPSMHLMPDGDAVIVSWPDPITFAYKDGMNARGTLDATHIELRLDDAAQPGALGSVAGALTGSIGLALAATSPEGETASTTIEINGLDIQAPEGDGNDRAEVRTAFGSMRFSAQAPQPDQTSFQVTGENGAYEGTFVVEGLAALAQGDPIAAVSQGTNFRVNGQHGAGTYAIVHPTESGTQSWSEGRFNGSIDRGGVTYSSQADGLAMEGALPDGMGSFAATATQAAFALAIPLFAQAEAQDARVVFSIADLAINASGINLPAEAAALFAEPMSIAFDATARMELFADLWPKTMNDEPEDPSASGRITSVELTTLDLAFAGSTANATGTATLSGTNFGDSQPASAQATVTLGTITSALDALQSAGLLDAPTRGMAEGMMRGFAKPGETDPLTYDVQMEDAGSFTVNGNRF